jgi:hypothetical protein
MDSFASRSRARAESAALDTLERRLPLRHPYSGQIVLLWHHDPSRACTYETVDTSESGARVRTSCPLLEGMTGVALRLNPGELPIDRTVMVVWCRGIRDGAGRLTHHEAGLRFF